MSAPPGYPAAPMILGDWGNTRLRLFLRAAGQTLDRIEGPGIGGLEAPAADTLDVLIAPWIARHEPQRIVLCGMAGSRGGLVEAPYARCPAHVSHWAQEAVASNAGPLPLVIASGVSCKHPDGVPDVMRGEETQIFGALSLHGELNRAKHLIVLPGTHAKWVQVIDGRIAGFQTYITGEMFAVLRDRSSLARLAGDGGTGAVDTADSGGFLAGLERAANKRPFSSFFEARAAQLQAGQSGSWALGFLSGLLIGHEVNEALAAFDSPDRVGLIGDPLLTARYRTALSCCGVRTFEIDGDSCAIAGLHTLANKVTASC